MSDIIITLWSKLLKLWFVAHAGMKQSHKSKKASYIEIPLLGSTGHFLTFHVTAALILVDSIFLTFLSYPTIFPQQNFSSST